MKSIRTGVKPALRRAGLRDMRIRDFRHRAAVGMLGEGVTIEKVGQIPGRSNLTTTSRSYGRFLPDQMTDAINVLNFTGLRDAGSQVQETRIHFANAGQAVDLMVGRERLELPTSSV